MIRITVRSLVALMVAALWLVTARAQAPQNPASPAQPAVSAAAPSGVGDPNYRIGVGDVLEVRVLGHENMSGTVRVSNAGTIRVPFVDEDVKALCATEREIAETIKAKLKKYLRHPEVFVAVKEFVGNPIFVTGAVGSPQQLRTQRTITLLEALVHAGGLNQRSGSVAFIFHSGTVTSCDPSAQAAAGEPASEIVSLSRLKRGEIGENRTLRPGDIVIVSEADQVFVAGEVFKPNAYTLVEGLTLTKLMALAGGPTGVAKTDSIRINRQEPGKPREEIVVNLKKIHKNEAEDPALLANDVVEVPGSKTKAIFKGFLNTIGGTVGNLPVRAIP